MAYTGEVGATITVEELSKNDEKAWDNFVNSTENSNIYQLSSWRDLIRNTFGHKSFYLCAKDKNGSILAILPIVHLKSILFGNFLVSMPFFNYGGGLAKNDEAYRALQDRAIEIAKDVSASHIEFRDQSGEENRDWPTRTDKLSMRLELPEKPEELWIALGSKLRSQIKRPKREEPEVRQGGLELLDDFYQIFSRNMRDLGTPVYSKSFFRAILEIFKGNSFLIVVYWKQQPVAGGFLLGHKGMLEIPWASSLREYNKMGFNMLMYWSALEFAIENKYVIFDFGRSSIDSGTYKFKKQWGAEPVQLHWHYWLKDDGEIPMLNPANPKYNMAINIWKKIPLPIANSLGPMIVKNLP